MTVMTEEEMWKNVQMGFSLFWMICECVYSQSQSGVVKHKRKISYLKEHASEANIARAIYPEVGMMQ